MSSSTMKYLFVAALLMPALSGCSGDDDDESPNASAPPEVTEPEPGLTISRILAETADGDPVELDDPDALSTDIETTFGASTDTPQEPEAVLDLSGEA